LRARAPLRTASHVHLRKILRDYSITVIHPVKATNANRNARTKDTFSAFAFSRLP